MITCSHQLDEHIEHAFGSRYDDMRERYAAELQDLRADDMMRQWYEEYMSKVWNAGFGTDDDAYEAYWSRALKYYSQF